MNKVVPQARLSGRIMPEFTLEAASLLKEFPAQYFWQHYHPVTCFSFALISGQRFSGIAAPIT